MMTTDDDQIVAPSARTRWIARISALVYVALAIAYVTSAPDADESITSGRGVRLWVSLALAVLMVFTGLYFALLSIASLYRAKFPSPGFPVFLDTRRREGRAAITPALVCLVGAAGLLAIPIMYFWGWAQLL